LTPQDQNGTLSPANSSGNEDVDEDEDTVLQNATETSPVPISVKFTMDRNGDDGTDLAENGDRERVHFAIGSPQKSSTIDGNLVAMKPTLVANPAIVDDEPDTKNGTTSVICVKHTTTTNCRRSPPPSVISETETMKPVSVVAPPNRKKSGSAGYVSKRRTLKIDDWIDADGLTKIECEVQERVHEIVVDYEVCLAGFFLVSTVTRKLLLGETGGDANGDK